MRTMKKIFYFLSPLVMVVLPLFGLSYSLHMSYGRPSPFWYSDGGKVLGYLIIVSSVSAVMAAFVWMAATTTDYRYNCYGSSHRKKEDKRGWLGQLSSGLFILFGRHPKTEHKESYTLHSPCNGYSEKQDELKRRPVLMSDVLAATQSVDNGDTYPSDVNKEIDKRTTMPVGSLWPPGIEEMVKGIKPDMIMVANTRAISKIELSRPNPCNEIALNPLPTFDDALSSYKEAYNTLGSPDDKLAIHELLERVDDRVLTVHRILERFNETDKDLSFYDAAKQAFEAHLTSIPFLVNDEEYKNYFRDHFYPHLDQLIKERPYLTYAPQNTMVFPPITHI